MRPLIDYFMQLHNIGVPQVRQCLYFSTDSVCRSLSHQVLLIVCLYRYYVFCFLVLRSPHDSKRPLADLQAYLKVFQAQGLLFRL